MQNQDTDEPLPSIFFYLNDASAEAESAGGKSSAVFSRCCLFWISDGSTRDPWLVDHKVAGHS